MNGGILERCPWFDAWMGRAISTLPKGASYSSVMPETVMTGLSCTAAKSLMFPSGEVLVTGDADIFWNIASDANGKLYGTTTTCGFGTLQRNTGMIWQYSP